MQAFPILFVLRDGTSCFKAYASLFIHLKTVLLFTHLSVGRGSSYPQSSGVPDSTSLNPVFRNTLSAALFSCSVLAVTVVISVLASRYPSMSFTASVAIPLPQTFSLERYPMLILCNASLCP